MGGDVADRKIHIYLPDMRYHVKFGSCALKGVCIEGNPKNWGALGLAPLAVGASLTP